MLTARHTRFFAITIASTSLILFAAILTLSRDADPRKAQTEGEDDHRHEPGAMPKHGLPGQCEGPGIETLEGGEP